MEINAQCSMSQDGILLNLEKGLESEYRAKDVCQELLAVLTDEVEKAQIQKIINDEEKHIKITEKLIDSAKNYYGR